MKVQQRKGYSLMKKLLKTIFLVVMLILVFSTTVFAGDLDDNGTGGSGTGGSANLNGRDGASYAKTFFLIYTCDGAGNATSPIVVRSTYGNEPVSTSGAPIVPVYTTRFGQLATEEQFDGEAIAWGKPPFTGSGSGMGEYIKLWLTKPYHDVDTGAEWVLRNYLHMSDEQILAWADKEDSYLCIESGMYAGVYSGTSHRGWVLSGGTTDWARFTSPDNYLGNYTHRNLPNSLAFDKAWLGLQPPSDISNKHSSGDILSSTGYGIIAVKPKMGDKQIVKVYKTAGQVDGTSYGTCGEDVSVKDEGSL